VIPTYKRTFSFPSSHTFRTFRFLPDQEEFKHALRQRRQQSEGINGVSGVTGAGLIGSSDAKLQHADRTPPKIIAPNHTLLEIPNRPGPATLSWMQLTERQRKQGLPRQPEVTTETTTPEAAIRRSVDGPLGQTRSNEVSLCAGQGINDAMSKRFARTKITRVQQGSAAAILTTPQRPLTSCYPNTRDPSTRYLTQPASETTHQLSGEATYGIRTFRSTFGSGRDGPSIAGPDPAGSTATSGVLESGISPTRGTVRTAANDFVTRGIGTRRGIPFSGSGKSGEPSDTNTVDSYRASLAPADGSEASSLSGITGELWLDTLLLRNWLQTYLSTEMKHASRGRDRVQDMG
jgi:hypothetical protein